MASMSKPPPFVHRQLNPTSLFSAPVTLSFPYYPAATVQLRVSALKPDGDKIGSQESYSSNLLRKPVISPTIRESGENTEKEEGSEEDRNSSESEGEDEEGWIDWEDKILEDTVPLVGFVRMILHSGR